jgi:hypothetical protein
MTTSIQWSSQSGSFEIASMTTNIKSSSSTQQYVWQLQQTEIDHFKPHAGLEEKKRLREALKLIPSNALFFP